MEHGSGPAERFQSCSSKNFRKAARKGVQDQRAVRINDALESRCAGGEAHLACGLGEVLA